MKNQKQKTISELNKLHREEYEQNQTELSKSFNLLKESAKNSTGIEAKLHKKMLKIVENETYFSIEHVDRLEIPYDILIVISAKNSGKTHTMYGQMREWVLEGKKFIFLRSTLTELKAAADHFYADDTSPCVIIERSGRFYVYDKQSYMYAKEEYQRINKEKYCPYPTHRFLSKFGIEPVGLAVEFSKANMKLGSGTFKDYSRIIFDECTTAGELQIYKPEHIRGGTRFISSVIRNKKDLKVFMYGNLTVNNTEILSTHGINTGDEFRYINGTLEENTQASRILFINFKHLYKASYANQAGIAKTGSLSAVMELKYNKPVAGYKAVVGYFAHPDLCDHYSIVYGNPERIMLLEIKYFTEEENSTRRQYIIKISEVSAADIFMRSKTTKIYTDCICFSNIEGVLYKEGIFHSIGYIFRKFERNKLLVDDLQSYIYMNDLYTLKNSNFV